MHLTEQEYKKGSARSRHSSHGSLNSTLVGGSSSSRFSMGSTGSMGRWSQVPDTPTKTLPRRASSASVAAYTEPFMLTEEAQSSVYGTMSKASRQHRDRHHKQQSGKVHRRQVHTPRDINSARHSSLRAAVRRNATSHCEATSPLRDRGKTT